MISIKDLKDTPEYWLENVQNKIYYSLKSYMAENELNQTELAKEFGYSKGYISQILSGEFNYSIKKFIDLSLAMGLEPVLEFKKKSYSNDNIQDNCKVIDFNKYTKEKIDGSKKLLNINSKNDLVLNG